MSQNIEQIFVANPASSMLGTDLLYLGRSPYDSTDDFAITFTNFLASIGTATPTASTIPRWDSHVNMSANNFLGGYATTATAAATTTLNISSTYNQYFTGSTTQTVILPVTSTLVLGFSFRIVNNSSGVVTVQSSGLNTIQALAAGSTLLLTCILTSGTTAASWDAQYIISADVSGAVLLSPAAAQTISTYPLNVNGGVYTPKILDSNGANLLTFQTVASAVNYINAVNNSTGNDPGFTALGSDTNINIAMLTKGTGQYKLLSNNLTTPLVLSNGTGLQHSTNFSFANTAFTRTVTFPDATGTVAFVASSAQTFNGDSGSASPSAGTITFTGGTSGLTFSGSSATITLLGTLALSNGGTNASLTASNGGIFYSTSTACAILSGTASAGQMLQSGSNAAPAWSTSTYPATNAINTLLYASSANVMSALATANSSMLVTNGSGVPSWQALTAGQIFVGTTSGSPSATTINSGTGITVTNSTGSITVSASGGGLATVSIAGTTQTAVVSTKYIALNAAQTTLTLPTTFVVGEVISLIGSTANTGGWIVQAPGANTVRVNNATTSAGGTVTSSAVAGQTISLVADVANTSWVMTATVSVLLTTA